MNCSTIRVLLLADTHLGLDLPRRPRTRRRHRGEDLFDNLHRALEPARRRAVDLVVHGGDVFNRSRPGVSLVQRAFEPLIELARSGTDVVIVPGNHERGCLPRALLARHPRLHVMDRPRSITLQVSGLRVTVAGFPHQRIVAPPRLRDLVGRTCWSDTDSDIRLLCMHQAVQGSQVGVSDYTFRHGDDVIRGVDIPAHFAAVLSGHIHRAQIVDGDLTGHPLETPVIYPGSIERTSFDERLETKGTWWLTFSPTPDGRGRLVAARFNELPARPMVLLDIDGRGVDAPILRRQIRTALTPVPANAIVRVRVKGPLSGDAPSVLRASSMRQLAPETMTLSIRFSDASVGPGPASGTPAPPVNHGRRSARGSSQLSMVFAGPGPVSD